MPLLIDFESRSRADLRRVGGRLYWEHPSTEALCAVMYDTASGAVRVWRPGDAPPDVRDVDIAAHNAMGFDRFAAARAWGVPASAAWIDTSELARRAGLPGALDALGTRWAGVPKDREGSAFVRGLSTCRRPSGKRADAITPEVWRSLAAGEKRRRGVQRAITPDDDARIVGYCASDVEILAHGWPMLESWRALEPDVERAERTVNDRGVAFDAQLAVALLEADARNADRVLREVASDLGWSPARVRAAAQSPAQFVAETGAPNAQKITVAALTHPLARARAALASIARGKLRAGLARVSADGRARDAHRYYGAHTGRWSGHGMQLQNMPRPTKRFDAWTDADVCRAANLALRGDEIDAETINVLLRATLVARPGHVLCSSDFSSVEARALAWCAGDHAALDVFRSGRDPYRVMASMIFGCAIDEVSTVQRTVGKICELAAGYGMGADKFGWTAAQAGADLDALGVHAGDVISAWRALHAPIVRFWRACENAWCAATRGRESRVDRFTVAPSDDGADVAIFLPSGRPIVYTDARVDAQGELSYHGTRGREHIYGGKIAENAIQALCRDLLAHAIVEAERAGLPVVLHVHDELVCETPESTSHDAAQALHAIMTDVPEWAAGFPAGASGHVGRRYRK